MSLMSGVLAKRRDPLWDLEGSGVRRRRRVRRVQAALAWVDLGAIVLLVTIGPGIFRLAFLP